MAEHPIEAIMSSAMISIQDMIDVNTIIGDSIETANGITIIPVSKVSFGFAAGGSEFSEETVDEYVKKEKDSEEIKYKLPFGGGSGAGASINPIAFIVVQNGTVKLLPINYSSSIDKLLDYVPDLLSKVENVVSKKNPIEDINKILSKDKKENTEEENCKKDYEFKYSETQDKDLDD